MTSRQIFLTARACAFATLLATAGALAVTVPAITADTRTAESDHTPDRASMAGLQTAGTSFNTPNQSLNF